MTRRRFCFTCERERLVEFECRACGDRECALCVDGTLRLCGACAYETQSAAQLRALVDKPATRNGQG
ncbi:MAG: hypothetical protein JWN44_6673 [Myxococcales bacterium]|nr:hypothetical protein [Myxococcales bacterium]